MADGWHVKDDRRAFVLQNTNGHKWGARTDPKVPSDDNRTNDETAERVAGQIAGLWDQLLQEVTQLDRVVIYLGSRGCERAIALAGQLPASKVMFVGCDCGLPIKEALVQVAGLGKARRLLCECGGHATMQKLYKNFLNTGSLSQE